MNLHKLIDFDFVIVLVFVITVYIELCLIRFSVSVEWERCRAGLTSRTECSI